MEKTMDFAELEELKAQFDILNEKLEKQVVINDNLIHESMKNKMTYFERFYGFRFISSIFVTPLVYLSSKLDPRIPLEFILFIAVFAIVNLIFDIKCYRILSPKKISAIGMVTAVENITKFRRLRNILRKVVWMFSTVLFVWLVGIFSDFQWDWVYILMGIMWVGISVYTEIINNKKVNTTLDEALEIINELRSE